MVRSITQLVVEQPDGKAIAWLFWLDGACTSTRTFKGRTAREAERLMDAWIAEHNIVPCDTSRQKLRVLPTVQQARPAPKPVRSMRRRSRERTMPLVTNVD